MEHVTAKEQIVRPVPQTVLELLQIIPALVMVVTLMMAPLFVLVCLIHFH